MPGISLSADQQRGFLFMGTVVLAVAALYWAQLVLIPLALAVLLTFILSPVVVGVQRWGLPRVAAVIVVVLLAFAVLGGILYTVGSQVRSFAIELPAHQQEITEKIRGLQGDGEGILNRFVRMIKEISARLREDNESRSESVEPAAREKESAGRAVQPVRVVQDPPSGLSLLSRVAGPLLEPLASAGLVIVLVIFMLIQREDLRNRVIRLVGHGRLTNTTKALDDAAQRISGYLLMQLLVNVGFGICLGIGMALVGVRYALLWGVLGGVLRFIPYVGTWIAALLPLTYSLVFFPVTDWSHPVLVLCVFGVLELFTYQVVEPLLFSHSTGVSPIALIIAAAFWAWLWGPIGLILSTPLTTCLVVLGRHVPSLEFLEVLLGDAPVLDVDLRFYQRLLAHDQDEAIELVDEFVEEHNEEELCENLLLPALVCTKRDRLNEQITQADERFIFSVIEEVLDDLRLSEPRSRDSQNQVDGGMPLVLGCPAHDDIDALALRILAGSRAWAPGGLKVLSADTLAGEVIDHVRDNDPAAVLIASLPPGGFAHVRYLCKRLRTQFPDLKIVVGRWGQKDGAEESPRVRERLQSAGANVVTRSLAETRQFILPLAKVRAVS